MNSNDPNIAATLSRRVALEHPSLAEFRQAWSVARNDRAAPPSLAAAVAAVSVSATSPSADSQARQTLVDLIRALLGIDIEQRLAAKLPAPVEEYHRVFPRLRPDDDAGVSLLAADYAARRQGGEAVRLEDYVALFGALDPRLAEKLYEVDRQLIAATMTAGARTETPAYQAAARIAGAAAVPLGPLPEIPGFEVLSYVAQGGMGIVYKVRDPTLNRTAALKIPRADYALSEDEHERFLTEARAAAHLEHPHICQVYRADQWNGRPYIVMAFITGQTLKAWAEKNRPDPRACVQIVATVARAVAYAHRRGVLHRDLKPSNIMIREEDQQPVLMDFGLAKQLGALDTNLTISGQLIGTPAYMAPEQAAGDHAKVGPTTDVYALGVILYELLTGAPLFRGTLAEVLRKVETEEPASLRRSRPNLPVDLETICLKAIAKQPARRYASAADLAEDLERFLAGEPILARRESPLARLARRVRKYPVVSLLSGGVLLVLIALALTLPVLRTYYTKSNLLATAQRLIAAPDFDETALDQVNPLITSLDRVSAQDAATLRQSVRNRLLVRVTRLLEAPHIAPKEGAKIESCLAALAQFPDVADHQADAPLHAQWDGRRRGWNPLEPQSKPLLQWFAGAPLEESDDGLVLSNSVNQFVGHACYLAKEGADDIRMEAEFTGALNATGVLGLTFKSSGQTSSPITRCCFSPDGKQAVTAGRDGQIHFWDVSSGAHLSHLPAHQGPVTALVSVAQRGWLLSAGEEGRVRVWNLADKTLLKEFAVKSAGYRHQYHAFGEIPLAVSADGAVLAAGGGESQTGGEIQRWRLDDFKPLPTWRVENGLPTALAFSADGQTLIAGKLNGELEFWDIGLGKRRGLQKMGDKLICRVVRHPSANRCALLVQNEDVQIVDVATGAALALLRGYEASATDMAFDAGGARLAVSYTNAGVKIWDLEKGQASPILRAHSGHTTSVDFSPDGARVLSAGRDGRAVLWNAAEFTLSARLTPQHYSFLLDLTATDQPSGTPGSSLRQGRLRLLRDGFLLREQAITLSDPVLKVAIRQEGINLRMQVNNGRELIFREHLPLGSGDAGKFAVEMCGGIRLRKLTVESKPTPTAASSLEKADRLFAQGRYAPAHELYQEQFRREADPDSAIAQEARCKTGLCLLRLNETAAAEHLLADVVAARNARKDLLVTALVELWRLELRADRKPEAAKLFATLQGSYQLTDLDEVIPEETRREILYHYSENARRRNAVLQPGSRGNFTQTLQVAEFLGDANLARECRWLLLAMLRITGDKQAADQLAEKLTLEIKNELNTHFRRSELGNVEMEYLRRFGLLCRSLGTPERALPVLAAKLAAAKQLELSTRFEEIAELWLEQACSHAAQGKHDLALEDLHQTFTALAAGPTPFLLYSQACLLQGVELRAQGDEAAAQAAWRRGTKAGWQSLPAITTDRDVDSSFALLHRAIIGSLSESVTAEETTLIDKIARESLPASVREKLQAIIPPMTGAQLNRTWQQPRAQVDVGRFARRELQQAEQLSVFAVAVAVDFLQQRGFGDHATPDEQEVVWQLGHAGYLDLLAGRLDREALKLVMIEFFNPVGAIVNYEKLINRLSPQTAAPMAYVLGEVKARAPFGLGKGAAAEFFRLAVAKSPAESTVHRLAEARLKQLNGN